MRKIASHLKHSDVMLRVNPEVAKALKANNARLLIEMEELTKKTIIVKSDPALHQEKIDIHYVLAAIFLYASARILEASVVRARSFSSELRRGSPFAPVSTCWPMVKARWSTASA